MMQGHVGELAAFFTAICWTLTAISYEYAGKRVGSLAVNLIRLVIAFSLLGLYSIIRFDSFLAEGASFEQWGWLGLSGLVGLVFGDLCLFQAYLILSARIAQIIFSLTPPITAFLGWLFLGEHLSLQHLIGMLLTLSGIFLVILVKAWEKGETFSFNYPLKGILLAIGGAIGQAAGLVLSKYGMKDYDPFSATQIRVIFAILGFFFLSFFTKTWPQVFKALSQKRAMAGISIGAFFGPFLGVSLSLLSIQFTSTGVASTIMGIVPVLIIAPSVWVFKEKIRPREVLGAIIAVIGIILFFI